MDKYCLLQPQAVIDNNADNCNVMWLEKRLCLGTHTLIQTGAFLNYLQNENDSPIEVHVKCLIFYHQK